MQSDNNNPLPGNHPPLENVPPATAPSEKSPPLAPRVAKRNDPLHGITLKSIVNQLVEKHGWREMGRRIPVRCFKMDPSVKSSLTFLRKTPWAREKIEDWFISEMLRKPAPKTPTKHSAAKPET